MFNSMDRQVFPALLSAIIPRYGLTLPQAGFVSAVFTVMVAVFGALSGWFMGRFGRKTVLVGGLIAYSIFTLVTPLATGFVSLAMYRTLTGAGEALQVGAVFACLGGYFGERRGTFMGIIQAFFGLGALLGPVLGARLFVWSGTWEVPFYVFGCAGILMAFVIAAAVPGEFSDASEDLHPTASVPDTAVSVFLSRNVMLMAAAFFLIGTSFFRTPRFTRPISITISAFPSLKPAPRLECTGWARLGAWSAAGLAKDWDASACRHVFLSSPQRASPSSISPHPQLPTPRSRCYSA
jgi:MFS family permease